MESRAYMVDHLKQIHDRFPNLSIRYQYDPLSKFHIVKVEPQSEFDGNAQYIDMEMDLTDKFESLFLSEQTLFISEDSVLDVDQPELILAPDTIPAIRNTLPGNNSWSLTCLPGKGGSLLPQLAKRQ